LTVGRGECSIRSTNRSVRKCATPVQLNFDRQPFTPE
jgi:hypothetical protein